MAGGITILLILIIVIGGVIAAVSMGGGIQGLRHRPGGDLNPDGDDDRRREHRVAEPTDEHAVGYGVGGEHGDHPRPARVPHDA